MLKEQALRFFKKQSHGTSETRHLLFLQGHRLPDAGEGVGAEKQGCAKCQSKLRNVGVL